MLPNIELRAVNRKDVIRIVEWLEDNEVQENWFGRYTYGEPAHLGYEPAKMVDATKAEGEAQLAIDEALGDAQLSILIGRKDLWHSGFGTASTLALLDHIFNQLDLYRAWVDVPEYNTHAREMFEHVGFIHEGTLRKSRPHHGARFDSVILGMLRAEYERKFPHEEGQISHTV